MAHGYCGLCPLAGATGHRPIYLATRNEENVTIISVSKRRRDFLARVAIIQRGNPPERVKPLLLTAYRSRILLAATDQHGPWLRDMRRLCGWLGRGNPPIKRTRRSARSTTLSGGLPIPLVVYKGFHGPSHHSPGSGRRDKGSVCLLGARCSQMWLWEFPGVDNGNDSLLYKRVGLVPKTR